MEDMSYKFGMEVESIQNPDSQQFFVAKPSDSGIVDNPYGDRYFVQRMKSKTSVATVERVTSIPSPYARMHITDIAFRELNAGKGVLTTAELQKKTVSKDYFQAMSHCLDLFELFFHYEQLDLLDKGIQIEKVDLVSLKNNNDVVFLSAPGMENLKSYIETLDLYRAQYNKKIDRKRPVNYKFDFSVLYVFKDNKGKVFASTSPFTGFFAKADCDLSDLELVVNEGGNKRHKLLTNNQNDWMYLKDRSKEFQEFMYLLLKQNNKGLCEVFSHLWDTVRNCIDWGLSGTSTASALDGLEFSKKYPYYNFDNNTLPQIKTRTGSKEVYLRSSVLDRSYLKFLLFLYEKHVDLVIGEDLYHTPINQRVFPDGSDIQCNWVCGNDILSDTLFILPYEINEKYLAVKYRDNNDVNKTEYRKCLLPIKPSALEYLDVDLEELANNTSVVRYENKNQYGATEVYYAVTLKIKLNQQNVDGVYETIEIRREYRTNYKYPNGLVFEPETMENFAFGVYPFVRSEEYKNIYKILFYNKFKGDIQSEDGFCLDFYYYSNFRDRSNPGKYQDKYYKWNYTHDMNDNNMPFNAVYYSLEGEEVGLDLAYAELKIALKDETGTPIKDNKNKPVYGSALIVPKLETKHLAVGLAAADFVNIAVDLGTSNTYVAYKISGAANQSIFEINTLHDNVSEITFLNKTIAKKDFDSIEKKYSDDLYLSPATSTLKKLMEANDSKKLKRAWTLCMPTQFSEFIPAHIVPEMRIDGELDGINHEPKEGFHFPIPSVINTLKVKGGQNTLRPEENCPLVHSAIPFAYYETGSRPTDQIVDGEFKWFRRDTGNGPENDRERFRNLSLFVQELMFILRSHMLSEGYPLNKCRLIWTYPLAFDSDLEDSTKEVWERTFAKYFIDPTKASIGDPIINTNESLSPLYDCKKGAVGDDHFNLLMDIGGGSTDVIGYKNNNQTFVTSFEFAGNALCLSSKKNNTNETNNSGVNIIKRMIEGNGDIRDLMRRESYFDDATSIRSLGNSVASIMNYGFTKHPTQFSSIFKSNKLKFFVQFHNAAIIYHTAQLCKLTSPDELPNHIYLTGNGSNLFKLLGKDSCKQLFKSIFKNVYGKNELDEEEIIVVFNDNPKAATARGALKMYDSDSSKFDDTQIKAVTMLGDSNSIYLHKSRQDVYRIEEDQLRQCQESVYENVISFVDVFYKSLDEFSNEERIVSKKSLLKYADYVKGNSKLKVRRIVSDSYFFQFIALIMEKVSQELCEK